MMRRPRTLMRRLSKEEAAAEAEEEEEGAAEKEEEEGAAAVSAARCSPGSRRNEAYRPIVAGHTRHEAIYSIVHGRWIQCRTIQYDIIYQCSKLNHTQRFVVSNSDGSEVARRGLYGTGPFWVDLSYTYCISESH